MTTFPTIENWRHAVLNPQDTVMDFTTREFYLEYLTKYAIGRLIKPSSILEVGVRFGYSAFSFLCASPDASYVGLDYDEPSYGQYPDVPREWAEEKLRKAYPYADIMTIKMNTLTDPIPKSVKPAAMVHIDGDHSWDGVPKELERFWTYTKRVMVVDDYGVPGAVQSAVDNFCGPRADVIKLSLPTYLPTSGGSAILVRI